MAAATFPERLLEDHTAESPPMTNEEASGIVHTLIRMHIREG
jgi:hypothetical protein